MPNGGVLGRVRNTLIEDIARQRAAELARAGQEARAARAGLDAGRTGLVASVRALLARHMRPSR